MTRLQALHPRLLGSALVAALVFMALPSEWTVNSRLLVAWDVGVLCYLAVAWTMAARSSTDMMQRRAAYEDDGAVAVLILTLAAALASLAAIAMELQGIHDDIAGQQVLRFSVAAVAILCSWFFVHTIYAFHYAHEYYGDAGERRGLIFPHENKPDYWDFLYFSFNFGAAGQTSDVVIVSKRMRRRALGHTILSFLFTTTILALAVNIGAELL
jgi:uncharacterized membrane protein